MRLVRIRFPIVVYPSEALDIGTFTAHCLNLDIIADDDTVEGAIGNLLETIEAHLDACEEHGADVLFHPAPREYWERAKRGQKLSGELHDRIVSNANRRLGHRHDQISVQDQCDIQVEAACA